MKTPRIIIFLLTLLISNLCFSAESNKSNKRKNESSSSSKKNSLEAGLILFIESFNDENEGKGVNYHDGKEAIAAMLFGKKETPASASDPRRTVKVKCISDSETLIKDLRLD